MTSHRKPKPQKTRKAPKVRLPLITFPSFYTLLGCTRSGRIGFIKTDWYYVEPEPVDGELAEW